MKHKVLIIKESDYGYNIDKLYGRIKEGLDSVFGQDYFRDKKRVLIKPNLLMGSEPEEAITTHPNFIVALAKVLKDKRVSVFVADNPGGFGDDESIKDVYTKSGLDKYPQLFSLLYNDRSPYVKEGIPFSWWTNSFDEIINVPKLKTHELTLITAALKNIFGFIPGIRKSRFHLDYPKSGDFAKVITQLHGLFRPGINILDGIVTLEGQGPSKNGVPKKRGLVIFSDSALALDYVLAEIIGIDPRKIPYLGMILEKEPINDDVIEIHPEDWPRLKIDNFVFSASTILETLPRPLLKIFANLFGSRLYVKTKNCKMCEKCIQICPAQAIIKKDAKKIKINNKKCIMCMCCQEVCPYGAIEARYGLVFNLIKRHLTKVKAILAK